MFGRNTQKMTTQTANLSLKGTFTMRSFRTPFIESSDKQVSWHTCFSCARIYKAVSVRACEKLPITNETNLHLTYMKY